MVQNYCHLYINRWSKISSVYSILNNFLQFARALLKDLQSRRRKNTSSVSKRLFRSNGLLAFDLYFSSHHKYYISFNSGLEACHMSTSILFTFKEFWIIGEVYLRLLSCMKIQWCANPNYFTDVFRFFFKISR